MVDKTQLTVVKHIMQRAPERRILIVDDKEAIRNLLLDFFSFYDYEAETAKNGGEALEMLKENLFSLLITDLDMPEMNGIELIRNVRNLAIPVIIIGMSLGDKESEFLKVGADYFLSKPFNFRYLKSILNFIFRE